jgi:hypothetical protein
VTSQADWLGVRRVLRGRRAELIQVALDLYPETARLGRTGFLMAPGWRPERPVELGAVDVVLTDAPAPAVTGTGAETLALRPLTGAGQQRYGAYHQAVGELDRPRLFENRVCYRLLDAGWDASGSGGGRLTLGQMRYFDMIDTGEALAHELALAATDGQQARSGTALRDRLALRALIPDPFDLRTYPLLLSISTLTLRRGDGGATFPLLRRGAGKVATGAGMLSVLPAGVFQPVQCTHSGPGDLDLWRNTMREYSEEFLGSPEHDGTVDYARDEPFRSLDAARRAGRIRVLCLGVGIDALSFQGDVITVAVFDGDVFDEIFGGIVAANEEGAVVGRGSDQFAFDGETIGRLLATEPLTPSGAACLTLAWEHRDSVLG